jgi:hypothetical protein
MEEVKQWKKELEEENKLNIEDRELFKDNLNYSFLHENTNKLHAIDLWQDFLDKRVERNKHIINRHWACKEKAPKVKEKEIRGYKLTFGILLCYFKVMFIKGYFLKTIKFLWRVEIRKRIDKFLDKTLVRFTKYFMKRNKEKKIFKFWKTLEINPPIIEETKKYLDSMRK